MKIFRKKVYGTWFFICVILFVFGTSIHADRTRIDDDCSTDFGGDGKTFVTFYGDSLGEWVSQTLYGYWGWNTYLSTWQPDLGKDSNENVRPWDVQNLAKATATTHDVWDILVSKCSEKDKNANFRTAKNVALEIGGNDYAANLAVLVYMPWKMGDVTKRVVYNTQCIVRALRHDRRDKNVLLMGNFPTMAKSPSLGNWPDYFIANNQQPSWQIKQNAEDLQTEIDDMIENAVSELPSNFIIGASLLGVSLNTIIDVLAVAELFDWRVVNNPAARVSPTGQDFWWWQWLLDNQQNQLTHATSIAMFLAQPQLEAMAAYENALKGNVHFLSLYPFFIRQSDCRIWGQCWVANPDLYSDTAHVNYLGYAIWSSQLSAKIKNLGWHNNTPAGYTGLVSNPGTAIVKEELYQDPVVVKPNNIDWALLFCLFTGMCW